MKKITIGIAVLVVAALVGYMGTTMVLNNNQSAVGRSGGRLLAQENPNPGFYSTNSKPTCPDCSDKEQAVKDAQQKLNNTIDFPSRLTLSQQLSSIRAARDKVKRAQEEVDRCNELKKAYCDGFDAGKESAKESNKGTKTGGGMTNTNAR